MAKRGSISQKNNFFGQLCHFEKKKKKKNKKYHWEFNTEIIHMIMV